MVEILEHAEPLPAAAEPMGRPGRLRFRLAAPGQAPKMLALLSSPSDLPRLHPLIHRVSQTTRRTEGTVETMDFSIDESIPLLGGLLSIPNTYRGRIAVDTAQPGCLRTSGWSMPNVRIEGRIVAQPDGTLEETLWFHAPWAVRALVRQTLVTSHAKTLEKALSLAREG